jgi:hypothetical protein
MAPLTPDQTFFMDLTRAEPQLVAQFGLADLEGIAHANCQALDQLGDDPGNLITAYVETVGTLTQLQFYAVLLAGAQAYCQQYVASILEWGEQQTSAGDTG